MQSLSPRLQAVADRVVFGQPMADIGTDHGALSCALVACGRVPRAIAVDVAKGPVARARAAVVQAGLQGQVEVRHGDGLAPLLPGEVGTVVICGMGGQTMRGILEQGAPKLRNVQRLVLSPHTAAEELRRFMVGLGWVDVEGCWVHDRGQHYPVAAWERGSAVWTARDFLWGRSVRERGGSDLGAYLRVEQGRLKRAHASACSGRGQADGQVKALHDAIAQIEEELLRLSGLGT